MLLSFCLFIFMNFFYLKIIAATPVTFPCPECQEECKEKATTCAHCGLKPISIQVSDALRSFWLKRFAEDRGGKVIK